MKKKDDDKKVKKSKNLDSMKSKMKSKMHTMMKGY